MPLEIDDSTTADVEMAFAALGVMAARVGLAHEIPPESMDVHLAAALRIVIAADTGDAASLEVVRTCAMPVLEKVREILAARDRRTLN